MHERKNKIIFQSVVILHNVLISGGLCSFDGVLIGEGFCIDISVLLHCHALLTDP
jgi:UDP-3-O-[3-hydroxymyristoyl] glucosamine N-acyltransferase